MQPSDYGCKHSTVFFAKRDNNSGTNFDTFHHCPRNPICKQIGNWQWQNQIGEKCYLIVVLIGKFQVWRSEQIV